MLIISALWNVFGRTTTIVLNHCLRGFPNSTYKILTNENPDEISCQKSLCVRYEIIS
jgi:hypothetical protein